MKRRKLSTRFVLESLKEHQSLNELAQEHELSPTQISGWKKAFLANAELIFENGKPDRGRGTRSIAKNDR